MKDEGLGSEKGRDVNIYDDDMAVTAVGGLFSGDEESPGEKEVPDAEGAAPDESDDYADSDGAEAAPPKGVYIAEKPGAMGREYKVREYFSEADDAETDEPAPKRTEARPGAKPPYPAVRPAPRTGRPAESDDQDYQDYINSNKRELAERQKKKERDALLNKKRDSGYVRDASRNPAVRRERDSEPDESGRLERDDRSVPRPDGARRATSRDTGREHPHTGVPKPAPRYSPSSGKLPVKGNVPRRNAFFETESRRSSDSHDAGPALLTDFRIVVLVGAALLIIIMVFLIVQNRSLSNQLKAANNRAATDEEIISSELYQSIKRENDTLQTSKLNLESEIASLNNQLAQSNAQTNQGNTNDQPGQTGQTGQQSNDVPTLPTPPPSQPTVIEYEIKPGDTITKIAREQLGDERRVNEILQLNNMTQQDALKIQPGQSILLPR